MKCYDKFKKGIFLFMFLFMVFSINVLAAPEYIQPIKPFTKKIKTRVSKVRQGTFLRIPCITWGGDIAAILSNGGVKTGDSSICDKLGLSIELYRQDDFVKQVEDYLAGKTPFLRGTLGMINVASEICSKNPKTKPIVFLQLTWSAGGDMLVVRKNIKRPNNLKNKTICLQQYSPHIDYLDTILRDAGLNWQNVNVKWTRELTQPPYDTGGKAVDPASAMRQDHNIDAVCCISPDGFALTSGGKVGTGAEDSVRGARILLSTKTANRVIADVWAVRKDYFDSHRKTIENFAIAYLQGVEELKKLRKNKQYSKNSYQLMLKKSANFLFDSPQATADIEGLLSDCEFADFSGNVDFFTSKGNLNNFTRTCTRIQYFLVREKYITRKITLKDVKWDYRKWKEFLDEPVELPQEKFKTAVTTKKLAEKRAHGTLEQDVLFEFTINFKPNQKSFRNSIYGKDFKRAIEISGRYGGAIVQIAGHSDPLGVLKTMKKIFIAKKQRKLDLVKAYQEQLILKKKAVINLSLARAQNVRDALLNYAKKMQLTIDPSQFTVAGFGIDQPLYSKPRNKKQWLSNMRVVFRIINVEAELDQFEKIDFNL